MIKLKYDTSRLLENLRSTYDYKLNINSKIYKIIAHLKLIKKQEK